MAGAYPFILLLLLLVAAAQLGLTAFLITCFDHNGWPGQRDSGPLIVKALIFMFVVVSAWTVLGSLLFVAFGDESNPFFTGVTCLGWLAVTLLFWLIPTVLFHVIREGDLCVGQPAISLCREFMAVEALGWTALILSVFALGAGAAAWFRGSRARRRYDKAIARSAYSPSAYSHSTYPTSHVAPLGSEYAPSTSRTHWV